MLKKTITYTDFNDVEQTDDFYFNLSKAEIAELNLRTEGGLVKHLQSIAATNNGDILVDKFKDLIKWAYGVKSDDGRRFMKSDQIWEEFTQTNAYSELFMELATDAQAGADFMNGIVPADLATYAGPQDHKAPEVTTVNNVIVSTPEVDPDREAFEAWKRSQDSNKSPVED